MPVLKYLADTNSICDYQKKVPAVRAWFQAHQGEIGMSVFTLAEMRQGVELRTGPERLALERKFRFVQEDYREAIFLFDEAAAMEWGKLRAETRDQLAPLDDSYIAAIARVTGMIVVTRNGRHFPGCETVNPWETETSSG